MIIVLRIKILATLGVPRMFICDEFICELVPGPKRTDAHGL